MARRLNTKFLTILLLVIAGMVTALLLAEKFLIHDRPDRYLQLGREAVKDHSWQDAVINFSKAARLSPHDPQIEMYLGAALAETVQVDPQALQLEVQAYQKALEIDPNYLPALQALSQLFTRELSEEPSAYVFSNAIDYTQRAHVVDPKDEKLQSLGDKLVIQEWASGLSTDHQRVVAAVQEMKDLWKKNPSDADLPFAIASAEIEEGMLTANQNQGRGQLQDVTDHYHNAVTTFESVLAGPGGGSQSQNASMHFYFARTLEQLSGLDRSGPDVAKDDQDRASAQIDLARKLAKPDNTDYVDINQFAANLALQRGDKAAAIAIYKAMPPTPVIEIALADILARSLDTQTEAVNLLKDTLASLGGDPNHIAFYGSRFRTMLELTKVQVYQYLEMPASPQKQKAHDDIRATLDRLDLATGVRTFLPLKETEARFEIGSGLEEEMQEIQTLNKLMADSPPPKGSSYWYTLQSLLAQGYEDTSQTSNATAILKEVVPQFPHDIPAREHLVRLLIAEDPDKAPAQIDELERLNPNNPALNVYRIELLMRDPDKNHDQIKKFYSMLKEDNVSIMSAKARVAVRINDYDEAIRLLKMVTTKDPSRVSEWATLSRLEYIQNDKDDALDSATRGLAANPKDPQLRMLILHIKGESPKVIEELQIELAKENPDKSQGELVLAGIAANHGDKDQEEAHLQAAAKYAPGTPHIQDLLFTYYLREKKFDQAAQCIPPLAKVDADAAGGDMYRLALAKARGDNVAAEAVARRLTSNKPEFARSWLALGDVLLSEGHFDEAIPQYNNCLQKASDVSEGYVGLAKCYYGLHKLDDALHTIDNGLARLPEDSTLSQMKLMHEINYGLPQDAIRYINHELTIHADQPHLYAAMADAVLRYCDVLNRAHQPDDAVKQAQSAIDFLTDPLAKWPDEPGLYASMSECQLVAHHPEAALKTLQAWADRPTWKKQPDPYVAMAGLYERLGMHDQSEDMMHTAMARSGYNLELELRMTSLLGLHKKDDEALAILHSVNEDKPEIQERIIEILLASGKFDQAHAELTADLAKHPMDSGTLLAIWSLAEYEHGRYPDAIDYATQALAINPIDPTSLFCRARSYLRSRPPNASAALADLQLVLQASPGNIEVKLTLSDAYLMLNRPDEAATELESGVRALPANKQLRMKLVSLYSDGPHPRLTAALKLLTDVDSVPPFDKDPDVFQNESILLSKLGNTDGALAKAEIARQLAPDDEKIVRNEMQLLMDAQNFQGIFDRYAELDDTMKSRSWALGNLALAEKRTSNPQALPDFNRALLAAEKDDQPAILESLTENIAQEFSYDDAVHLLLPISKVYVPAGVSLARLYQSHGDNALAVASVEAIMANFDNVSPRDQVDVLSSAAIMYQLAKPAPLVNKAYNAYLAWLKLEPANEEALNNIACLLADDYSPPRADEGLKFANQALDAMAQLGRTEPRLLDTRAWLLILSGSPDEGINILNQAMEDFPPFPEEYLHLGEGYLRKDSPEPAKAETQAKLGLQLVKRNSAGDDDAAMTAKLQDLVNRSEQMRHARQQAEVP
jgi:predicted Zn-dependent protease